MTFVSALALSGAALALPALPAHAASVFIGIDNATFPAGTNATAARTSFLAAAGTVSTQDFEGATAGDLGALTDGLFANGVGVTLANTVSNAGSSNPAYLRITAGVGGFDTYPTSGRQFLDSLSGPNSTYFTATFDDPVAALGFSYTDVSDWAGNGGQIPPVEALVTFGDGSTQVIDMTAGIAPTSLVNGNLAFLGIVEQALGIRSIAVRSLGAPDGDAIGFDDVMVSARQGQVPEPGSLALLAAAGLVGAGLSGRRRLPGAPCRSSPPV